jgi:hypothetical protein
MRIIVVPRFDHKSQYVTGLRRADCWTWNPAGKWRPRRSTDTLTGRREMASICGQAHIDLITDRDRKPIENRWNLKVGGDFKLDMGIGMPPQRPDSSIGHREDVDDCHSILASDRSRRRVARYDRTDERDDRKPTGNAPPHVRNSLTNYPTNETMVASGNGNKAENKSGNRPTSRGRRSLTDPAVRRKVFFGP